MNKTLKTTGILLILLGIGFWFYRINFVPYIGDDGIVIDALGYIVAGNILMVLGTITLIFGKVSSIRRKKLS